VQVLAAQVLTALCSSSGGEKGCAVAEQSEIDVLLAAMLASCFSVRDAALRVSGELLLKRAAHSSVCGRSMVVGLGWTRQLF
jgi:hypothetical protein